jgi:hypothetical protein
MRHKRWVHNDLVFATRYGTDDAANVRRAFRTVAAEAGLEGFCRWDPVAVQPQSRPSNSLGRRPSILIANVTRRFRVQTQLPLPESENGVVGSAM